MTRRVLLFCLWLICATCLAATCAAQSGVVKQPSFDSAGVPIHYTVAGRDDGEAVVLIHGFAGDIASHWGQAIAALKSDYKVVALDCRGHGGSGKPHEADKYGREMFADVVRLLDHLKIDKAHVVGYSMGAGIALGCAVYHPEHVRTVTLGGSSGMNQSQEKLIEAVAESLEKGAGIEPLVEALKPKDQPEPTAEEIGRINKFLESTNDTKALAAVARGMLKDKTSMPTDQQVQEVQVPLLAIIGSVDPLREGVERLKELRPATKVVIVDGGNHMTTLIRPEFVTELRKFLDEQR